MTKFMIKSRTDAYFYSLAALKKIKFISSDHHAFSFLLYKKANCLHHTAVHERAEIDVIKSLTSEDVENTPLGSQVSFRLNFASGVFSSQKFVFIS